jgi:hypothetical protein
MIMPLKDRINAAKARALGEVPKAQSQIGLGSGIQATQAAQDAPLAGPTGPGTSGTDFNPVVLSASGQQNQATPVSLTAANQSPPAGFQSAWPNPHPQAHQPVYGQYGPTPTPQQQASIQHALANPVRGGAQQPQQQLDIGQLVQLFGQLFAQQMQPQQQEQPNYEFPDVVAPTVEQSNMLQTLTTQAQEGLDLGRSLSDQETRAVQQSARTAANARGRVMDAGAMFAEVAGSDALARQREQERRAFAGQVESLSQPLQFANQGATLQSRLANQGAGLQAGLANQGAANQMAMFNEQMRQAQEAQALNFALQSAGIFQATGTDPFQAILGRPAQGGAQAAGAQQWGLGQQGRVFDPNAGVNLALQNASNQGNYNAAVYGANQARSGALGGGALTALGTIGGALIGGPFGAAAGGAAGSALGGMQ